jgi:hypothetical protein
MLGKESELILGIELKRNILHAELLGFPLPVAADIGREIIYDPHREPLP